jgi:hypothetical protein
VVKKAEKGQGSSAETADAAAATDLKNTAAVSSVVAFPRPTIIDPAPLAPRELPLPPQVPRSPEQPRRVERALVTVSPARKAKQRMPTDALSTALFFANRPSLADAARTQPLPADMLGLLRIAAGNPEDVNRAVQQTGKDPSFIYAAVEYFLEHVVDCDPADHYRLLGLPSGASRRDIAEHVRWLLKPLLPHIDHEGREADRARRVFNAWLTLTAPAAPPVVAKPEVVERAPRRVLPTTAKAGRHFRLSVPTIIIAALMTLGVVATANGFGLLQPALTLATHSLD